MLISYIYLCFWFSLLLTILGRTSPAEEWGGGLFHNEALVRDAVVGVGAHDIGAFRQAFFRIVGFLKLIQIMTQSR